MAGALGIQLAGPRVYGGVKVSEPMINGAGRAVIGAADVEALHPGALAGDEGDGRAGDGERLGEEGDERGVGARERPRAGECASVSSLSCPFRVRQRAGSKPSPGRPVG